MNRETEKAKYEREIFQRFLGVSGLDINLESIQPGDHTKGEPDILCESADGEKLAFELGRLTNPDLMRVQKSWHPENHTYVRTKDYSQELVTQKLGKKYHVDCQIHLLLYTEFPNASPESFIRETVEYEVKSNVHSFTGIWLMTKDLLKLH
jgi:hypothetical protein